jgi:hypothetical protein
MFKGLHLLVEILIMFFFNVILIRKKIMTFNTQRPTYKYLTLDSFKQIHIDIII